MNTQAWLMPESLPPAAFIISFMFSKQRSICGSAPATSLPSFGSSGAMTDENTNSPILAPIGSGSLWDRPGISSVSRFTPSTAVAINCTSMPFGKGA